MVFEFLSKGLTGKAALKPVFEVSKRNEWAIDSGFFRFWAPNSDQFFGLTQAKFEANSAYFHHVTQNFGIFKQKPCKFCPNSAQFFL